MVGIPAVQCMTSTVLARRHARALVLITVRCLLFVTPEQCANSELGIQGLRSC